MGERLNIRKKGAVDTWLIARVAGLQKGGLAGALQKNQKEVGWLPILGFASLILQK